MTVHIVHLLGTARAENTAITSLVEQIARASTADYRTSAIFMDGAGPMQARLTAAGIPNIAITWAGSRDISGHLALAWALGNLKPDLIHQHHGGWPARLIARLVRGVPVLLHLHGRDRESRPNGRLVQTTIGASAVIAVSQSVASDANDPRTIVIPNGIDVPQSSALLNTPDHLITASRLVPLRAVETLVEVAAALPTARLTIIGDGPDRARIEALIVERHLADRVHLSGWLSDITPVLLGGSIYVSAAQDEGFGLSIAQAMAAGLPVVAMDTGAVSELVTKDISGLLVPAGNRDAMINAVRQLINNPAQARTMGTNGRALIARDFRTHQMTDAVRQIYSQLLGVRR